jgi:predicted outer membrane repeat protein
MRLRLFTFTVPFFVPFFVAMLMLGVVLLSLAGPPAPAAQAAAFVVTSLDDSGPGTLRQAILDAQAAPGPDTITFDSSLTGGVIFLSPSLPQITSTVTIDGTGRNITVSGNDSVRVMSVGVAGVVALKHLTIANGRSTSAAGIFNFGKLTVESSTFFSNTATATNGGGILNAPGGVLTVTNTTFTKNVAEAEGGAIFNHASGTLSLADSTFSHNHAKTLGGGLFSGGMIPTTVSGTTFFSNTAGYNGGGISITGTTQVTLANSNFTNNRANHYGGGISNEFSGARLTIVGSAFSENTSFGSGGGISNRGVLTLTSSTFLTNTATAGGGGAIVNLGTLAVSGSTFSGNNSHNPGPGISNSGSFVVSSSTFTGNWNLFNYGAAIWHAGHGHSVVSHSTFFDNRTNNGGAIASIMSLEINNSTIYSNTAYFYGGAIYAQSASAQITVTNSTLANNAAHVGSGAIHVVNGGRVLLRNTIVSNSTLGANCGGADIINGGGNLSYPDATCPGLNANPLLGPLADNGGPTWTMALGAGSPAINAAVLVNCPPTDQRGVARPQGAGCDIGAFEWSLYKLFLPLLRR